MRQLLPTPSDPDAEVDPHTTYAADLRPAPAGRPWVLCNMVAAADGATAVGGRSGAIGGDTDRAVFPAVRAVADVILAAAGTVSAEGYRPHRPSGEVRTARQARGQAPAARIAVLSASLSLDPDAPLLGDAEPGEGPLVLTVAGADDGRRRALEAAGAEVVDVAGDGDGGADVTAALAELRRRGAEVVLVEGGPLLNGQLVAADAVDEWCLSVGPQLVGGDSARAARGGEERPTDLRLERVLVGDDGTLCLRYVRAAQA